MNRLLAICFSDLRSLEKPAIPLFGTLCWSIAYSFIYVALLQLLLLKFTILGFSAYGLLNDTPNSWVHSFLGIKVRRDPHFAYDSVVWKASQRYAVDPYLIKAIIRVESEFYVKNRSHKGACGFMQLMPETARILKVKKIYDPYQNIMGGTAHFKDMLRTFKGNVILALAGYNAGVNKVKRNQNQVPNIQETQKYVKDVMHFYSEYQPEA